jgi:hypothetical protein
MTIARFLCCVIVGCTSTLCAAEPAFSLKLHLTTKLGVDSTIDVKSTEVDHERSELIRSVADNFHRSLPKVAFELAEGVYLLFPWDQMKEAAANGTSHQVTLTDNTKYRGRFLTAVRSSDDRRFPLSSCNKVTVVKADFPDWKPTYRKRFPVRLSIDDIGILDGPISFVGFHSLCTRGFGFGWVHDEAEQFQLLVGGESVTGNLSDFQSLTISKAKDKPRWTVTVRAPQSQPVQGEFHEEFGEQAKCVALLFETEGGRKIAICRPARTVTVTPQPSTKRTSEP